MCLKTHTPLEAISVTYNPVFCEVALEDIVVAVEAQRAHRPEDVISVYRLPLFVLAFIAS